MVVRLIQPLTEIRIINFVVGKARPARKADDFTAVCEHTVRKTWEPRHLSTRSVTVIALFCFILNVSTFTIVRYHRTV
jgi:hypothetical protein